jgi:hypothetical protein
VGRRDHTWAGGIRRASWPEAPSSRAQ